MSWWDDWGPALPVEGGLTASGVIRGTRIATDAIGVGAEIVKRMVARANDSLISRGRAYARSGQTISMTIEPGRIHALVQGSAPEPYSVSLAFDVPPDHRQRLITAFEHALTDPRAGIPARGSAALREEIDECELLHGVPVKARCTCPYGAVCKHCIAVAYIAADRLDTSPIAVANLFGVRDEHLGVPADTALADD
ncbi:MAG: SWIM zinc finger family protein, partial [Acidimicrobiia bacterium]|nr:SWIM zinc finger family protein [Acidimicrobiia bacterium]